MRAPFCKILFFFGGLLLASPPSLAQTSSTEGYTPPPLFGTPSPRAPVRKDYPDEWGAKNVRPLVKPRVSVPKENEPLNYQPYIPEMETPLAPVELQGSIQKRKRVSRPPLKAPTPKRRPSRESLIKAKQAQEKRPRVSGVVKGPKTMPSVPARSVQVDQTFADQPQTKGTLMSRHLEQQKARQKKEEKSLILPPETDLPDLKNITLLFSSGQTTLDAKQTLTLSQSITRQLRQDPALKLRIEAFATAVDSGRSSDRRVALNRALNIRKALLGEGIAPHRINVRALGAITAVTPLDRVDLYLSR